ncbi:MAG TPA: response regulator [Vicinamibacterales bacterium]|nr:response regulator [Vicinamibacterales bacterium]
MNREPAKQHPGSSTGPKTILVVDDDDDVRELLRHYLEDLGYSVRDASGGQQALDRAFENGRAIDLLLTDVHMPRMGGGELAAVMAERIPNVRVILISADAPDSVVCGPLVRSGLRFIQKPLSLADLASQIRAELDAREVAAQRV